MYIFSIEKGQQRGENMKVLAWVIIVLVVLGFLGVLAMKIIDYMNR